MKHIISVLVENKFGVLTRIAGLFSGRGYNIHSLNVAPTHDPSLSRMTIVTQGDESTIEQHIDRELALIRIQTTPKTRTEAIQMAQIFRAKIVDVQTDSLTLEVTGHEGKIEKFIELMKHFIIEEIIRTGRIAISRE